MITTIEIPADYDPSYDELMEALETVLYEFPEELLEAAEE